MTDRPYEFDRFPYGRREEDRMDAAENRGREPLCWFDVLVPFAVVGATIAAVVSLIGGAP